MNNQPTGTNPLAPLDEFVITVIEYTTYKDATGKDVIVASRHEVRE